MDTNKIVVDALVPDKGYYQDQPNGNHLLAVAKFGINITKFDDDYEPLICHYIFKQTAKEIRKKLKDFASLKQEVENYIDNLPPSDLYDCFEHLNAEIERMHSTGLSFQKEGPEKKT